MTKKSGYKPSSLPPLLDLSNKDTRAQLSPDVCDPKKHSEDACRNIMEEHLLEWIETKDEEGLIAGRTREGDVKAFWLWLRDFHKEYKEDWFTMNMPRLKQEFSPVYNKTLKQQRAGSVMECTDLIDVQANGTASSSDPMSDLIDVGTQPIPVAKSPPAKTSIHLDLLDFANGSAAAPGNGNNLLDL